jgi:hypothetical protein
LDITTMLNNNVIFVSPGTPASSTTKTGRHDIAESGTKHNKSINQTKDDIFI